MMPSRRLFALAFAAALGCESEDGDPSTGSPGAGGNSSGGSVQTTPSGGVAGTPASGGASGGLVAGGSGGGAVAGAGGGGRSSNGGVGGGGAPSNAGSAGRTGGASSSAGSAGRSGGASSNGGSGGRSGGASSNGGSGPKAGGGSGGASAGAGGCVENLACKLQAPPSTGDLHQDCVDRINQFRTQCACLPPLERRTDGEACADQMAEYDAEMDEAHAGHGDKICTPSGAQNSCPGYSSNNQVIGLCLQQMWDEGPPPMTPCEGACFQEYGHFINMTSTSTTKVACGFFTTSAGKVWAVQNFSR